MSGSSASKRDIFSGNYMYPQIYPLRMIMRSQEIGKRGYYI